MGRTDSPLPRLWRGRRRRLLAGLVATGLAQAALAVAVALATPRLLTAPDAASRATWTAALVGAGVTAGLVRLGERVLAEHLGQSYVVSLRRRLLRAALTPGRHANLGITVARTTNDLTAIRSWVALGLAPLVSGVPLLAGVLVALALLSPPIAVAVTAVLVLLALVLAALAGPTRRAAREQRRRRGRMAARIADTVGASTAIRAAGGQERELRAIHRQSHQVAQAAVARATWSGAMRGASAGAAMVAMTVAGATGAWWSVDIATITTALLIVGVAATPVTDLGRVLEYRQAHLAAVAVIAPVLEQARRRRGGGSAHSGQERSHPRTGLAAGAVHLAGLVDARGRRLPELVALPGARVWVRGGREQQEAVVAALLGERVGSEAWLDVDGRQLGSAPDTERRTLLGYARGGAALENGTIARAVRYRRPDLDEPVDAWLAAVGLADRVAELPEGQRTKLRRGGEPLTADEQVRVQVARAAYGRPPLVVLDHVAEHLDEQGLADVRAALADLSGVVLAFGRDGEQLLGPATTWSLQASAPVLARPATEPPTSNPSPLSASLEVSP